MIHKTTGTYRRFSSHKTEADIVQWANGSWPDGLPKKDGANALSGAGSDDTATTQLGKTSRTKNLIIELKSLRDPEEFARCQRALEALQKQEDQGKIDLYYFDESGFALDPSIPYAWQEPASVIELPAMRYGRLNVLGFMNRNNDLHA